MSRTAFVHRDIKEVEWRFLVVEMATQDLKKVRHDVTAFKVRFKEFSNSYQKLRFKWSVLWHHFILFYMSANKETTDSPPTRYQLGHDVFRENCFGGLHEVIIRQSSCCRISAQIIIIFLWVLLGEFNLGFLWMNCSTKRYILARRINCGNSTRSRRNVSTIRMSSTKLIFLNGRRLWLLVRCRRFPQKSISRAK